MVGTASGVAETVGAGADVVATTEGGVVTGVPGESGDPKSCNTFGTALGG